VTNVYAPPRASLQPGSSADATLYTVNQIFAGALLASPLAGGLFMAHNYRVTGKPGVRPLVIGSAATIVLFGLGIVRPGFRGLGSVPILASFAMRAFAQAVQGRLIAEHVAAGRRLQPWWKAIGLSLGIATALFALLVGLVLLAQRT
jgi:hypothetical protein